MAHHLEHSNKISLKFFETSAILSVPVKQFFEVITTLILFSSQTLLILLSSVATKFLRLGQLFYID